MSIDDNQRSRDAVLSRIRAALHRNGSDAAARAAALAYVAEGREGPRPRLPDDLAQHFVARATDLASTVERVASQQDVVAAVGRYVASLDAGCADPEQDPLAGVCWPEFAALDWSAAGIRVESRPTLGHDAIGITGCYCAIVETGTLVFVTSERTPSASFLLPATHIAIVRTDQLLAAMEDAFTKVRAEHGTLPRAINLVSGPSRTGDIEQTIVLGAHGPRRLHIVLVGD